MAPDILCVMLKGIEHWESRTATWYQPRMQPTNTYEVELSKALLEQNDIGWENLIKGRISKCWATAQEMQYRREKADKQYTGNVWKVKLVRAIWKYAMEIWINRCNQEHMALTTEEQNSQREMIVPTMEYLYDKGRTMVRYTDQALFDVPLETRKKHHPKQQKKWIDNVRICMKAYQEEQKKEEQQQRKITRWFKPMCKG